MSHDRVVTLIDMDCFYCQVEERANISLKGKPVAVVQYNTWKGGGIIAVNYEARNLGVSRGMRGDEALKKCPEINLVSVPEVRGKADLTRYRDAGREVIAVLCEFSSCVEKASVDEAYVDLTEVINKIDERITCSKVQNTFVVGYSSSEAGTKQWLNDIYRDGINDSCMHNLARGATLVEVIRETIYTKTGFRCSAGISHNKILAKLACGMHKPNRQTVLPSSSVPILYESLPLKKIRSLGGKFGDSVRGQLGINMMGEVMKFSLQELQQRFGDKAGLWLYNIARGIDSEVVKARLISKSIGCCKNFKGPAALTTLAEVKHWINELATEIVDRIQDDLVVNKRKATLLVVTVRQELSDSAAPYSKSVPLNNYNHDEIVRNSFTALRKCNRTADPSSWSPALLFLGLSVGKFVDYDNNRSSLLSFFKPVQRNDSSNEQLLATKKGVDNDAENINTAELREKSERCISNLSVNTRVELREKSDSSSNSMERTINENHQIKNSESSDNSSSSNLNISDANNTEILNYQKSFFCKYFASKRLPEPSINQNSAETSKIQIQVDVHVPSSNTSRKPTTEEKEPIPSSSKGDAHVANISNYDSFPSFTKDYSSHKSKIIDLMEIDSNSDNSNSNAGSTVFNADDLTEICSECKKPIKLVEFLEHLDHHVASKLQEELNAVSRFDRAEPPKRDTVTKNILPSKSNANKKSGAEKRKHIKSKPTPAKRNLPITSFFSVKPPIRSINDE